MEFNNGLARKRFEAEQRAKAARYCAAGMCQEQIDAMYAFDLAVFNSDRSFTTHMQPIHETALEDEDEAMSPLLEKFPESLSCYMEQPGKYSRYWWVEEIADERLAAGIKRLSTADLELVTLFAIEGYTQADIALLQHTKRQNICNKIARIEKFLK